MTDIMLRMLDVIKNYRSKLLSATLINNDHPAHVVCIRFNASAGRWLFWIVCACVYVRRLFATWRTKCAQTFCVFLILFLFCFENLKKHPIQFSNKRFKSIFRPAHSVDWHCTIFNYMGANGFTTPAAAATHIHRPPSVHNVHKMCKNKNNRI